MVLLKNLILCHFNEAIKFFVLLDIISLGYVVLSGTSMSCPHVAGLSALIKAEDKYLTPEEVKNKIKDTAIDDIDRSHMRLIVRLVSDAKRAYIY